MPNILTIGLISEGTTDERFLPNIIRRTFEELAFDCNGEIEVYEPEIIKKKGNTFVEHVINAATENPWMNILCIHSDSDSPSDENVFKYKIDPAFERINQYNKSSICKNPVALVPIQMVEAWMLSDRKLLIDEIGTNMSITDLNLPINYSQIENISDPKTRIEHAIKTALENTTKRRRKLNIGELYSPISQKVQLSHLKYLSSYKKFWQASYDALKKMGYIT